MSAPTPDPTPAPSEPEESAPADGTIALGEAYAEDWRILPRILVVDDEPSVVDVFQEFLSAQGYEITVAGSGRRR